MEEADIRSKRGGSGTGVKNQEKTIHKNGMTDTETSGQNENKLKTIVRWWIRTS